MKRGRKLEAWIFAGLTVTLAACAAGPGPAASDIAKNGPVDATMGVGVPRDPAAAPGPVLLGFLTPETLPDAAAIIPVAPTEGDARNTSDWAVFRATRALKGTPRWELAINDDSYRIGDLLKDFSCAVGVELTEQNAPKLGRLMQRAAVDAANAAASAKEHYRRTRPYLRNEGEICIPRSEGLAKSFDFPSGHASASWVEGLMLAELAPDRSTQVLARARAYGESRVVCGVHNMSSVEAGRTNASGVYAALQGAPEFRAAMAGAKAELDAVRKSGKAPDAAVCAKEAELTRPLAIP